MSERSLDSLTAALQRLLEKYGGPVDGTRIEAAPSSMGGASHLVTGDGGTIPLLPWRMERRFVELKTLVETRTIEDVSTLRFCALSSEPRLERILFREFDLCVFLGASSVRSVFAVRGGERTANAIVKLCDGKSASVECAAGVPGPETIDRHELIARRGVACDRVVDTQVPQASVVVRSAAGERRFTDIDDELFGFSPEEIHLVRAAFRAATCPETAAAWNKAHAHAGIVTEAALKSEGLGYPVLCAEAE